MEESMPHCQIFNSCIPKLGNKEERMAKVSFSLLQYFGSFCGGCESIPHFK